MNRTLIFKLAASILAASFVFSAHAQSSEDSLAFVNADWHWTSLRKGAVAGHADLKMFGRQESISIVKYPAKRYKTQIIHAPGSQSGPTDTLAMESKGRIALNGSYFNMKTLEPVTFFTLGHELISRTADNEAFRTDGALAFKDKAGKKLDIVAYDPAKENEYLKDYCSFLASGPLLIDEGIEQGGFNMSDSFFSKNHPRSMIGITREGEYVLVDVDGRFEGKGEGASIPELLAIARYLGLYDALNLDGGGSSTIWTDQTGVMNHPNDNKTWDHSGCRKVPNAIIAR